MFRNLSKCRRLAGPVALAAIVMVVVAPSALAQPQSQSHLSASGISSAPAKTLPGHRYVLHGALENPTAADATAPVTIRLARPGQRPQVVGRASVRVPARAGRRYRAAISVPRGLAQGSYTLVACTPRRDEPGMSSCVTAERSVVIGHADPVRGPLVRTPAIKANDATCSSGARTLAKPGDHVYPELGNGGYTSMHTDVNLVYDAVANEFLKGTNVALSDTATECLSDFSLDFEAHGPDLVEEEEVIPGPDMEVESVTVNGEDAGFEFVQPTYAGDPNGPNDPNPAAHETGLDTPVSADNPLPPACAPKPPNAQDGDPAFNGLPCPKTKLVITPATAIAAGDNFDVVVNYKGRPGVHIDGDGLTEGWFRSDEPAGDGAFVTTEPAGNMGWMPLNNFPTAKPTYDFTERVTAGRTAISNGEKVSVTQEPNDPQFPNGGSTTWRWHSPEPIASYLVEASIGSFDLSETVDPNGVIYYQAQGSSIPAAKKQVNKEILDHQEEFTHFQEQFNGPYPFTTDGAVVGVPGASFQEEMQGKVTFNGGNAASRHSKIPTQSLFHENMHQWFGDNVSESDINETFYKEGLARLSEYLLLGREAAVAAGGLNTPAGEAAFEASLKKQFAETYEAGGEQWLSALSDPSAANLFENTPATYNRPAAGYIALRQILGKDNFTKVLKQIQSDFAGGSINESQLENEFQRQMPNQSPACHARLNTFFGEWFDTKYPEEGPARARKPQLTGPGLVASASGTTFYNADGTCNAVAPTAPVTTAAVLPAPVGGKITGPATVALTAKDEGNGVVETEFNLDGGAFQPYQGPLTVAALGAHKIEFRSSNRAGSIEATKTVEFTIVAPVIPVTTACANPHLSVAVVGARRKHGVATLRRGQAYRYTGHLTCGGAAAPAGTVIGVASVFRGRTVPQPGVTVGDGGRIDTLLRYAGKRTVVFSFADGAGSSTVRIPIAVAAH